MSLLIVAKTVPDHDGWVRKEIPAHLEEKFGLRDPNVVHVPDHDIKIEDLVGNKRDPHKIKTGDHIPRITEFHEENVHHTELDIQ